MIKDKKILIVEDEFSIALDIKLSLEEIGYIVIGIAHNNAEAIKYTLENKPDLIIMDINIAGEKDGIEMANDIYKNHKIPVVFLTGNGDNDTFKKALATKPFSFLLKPFNSKELSYTIQIALNKQEENNKNTTVLTPDINTSDTLFIKDKSQFIKVKIDDILWVEAMDNYVQIITAEKRVIANMFLKDFHEKVSNDKFFRVHRSFTVAIDKIENRSVFIGDKNIPISKAYKNQLLERLRIL